jgi:hypothetical protein
MVTCAGAEFLRAVNVGGILEPAGALGLDEIVERNQRNPDAIDIHRTRVRRRLLVFDLPGDRGVSKRGGGAREAIVTAW